MILVPHFSNPTLTNTVGSIIDGNGLILYHIP